MGNCRFLTASILLPVVFLLGILVQSSQCIPTREILKSNRKESRTPLPEEKTEVAKLCQTPDIGSIINPIISLVTSIPTSIISIIGNLTSSLGDIFSTGGGGGGLFGISIDFNKTSGAGGGGGGSPCNLLDPLLLANIPGIFIGVPLVILGIAILIGVIAAIVIAIGGLGGEITKSAYDKKNEGESGTSGYAPSVMPMYGTPVSSYGSPATVGSSYSRLAENVDTATQDFNNAYDKYSALLSQPQSQQQASSYQSSYSAPAAADKQTNQYEDLWNTNNVFTKRNMKQKK